MSPRQCFLVAVCTAALGGCPKKPATAPDGSAAPPPPPAGAAVTPDAGAFAPGLVAQSRVALRKDADEKSRAVTLLNFGERVRVLERGDAFHRVQLSDGTQGFLPARAMVVGMAQEATLTADQDIYVRPDALGPVRKREKPGVLMFVTADRDGWRQVTLPDRAVGWVPRDRAVTDAAEVAAAVALYRGEALAQDKKPEQAAQVYQDLLAQQPGARLAALVAQKLAAFPRDAGPGTLDGGGAADGAVGVEDAGGLAADAAGPAGGKG
ncbi:MAG: hypothetical protein HY904_01050 [Deltaproteobacteria bacterium]|nr:hypothetical protein [Deltaproteobacteria bacterium]